MNRSRMMLIVALLCAAIIAVVVLQVSWLTNSYAVSKEKNEAEIKELLTIAIEEQRQQVADTVRTLMQRLIHSEDDFNYRIVAWNGELRIGFAANEWSSYALYDIADRDTIEIMQDPYGFLVNKMKTMKLDELEALYSVVGSRKSRWNSSESAILRKISRGFESYEDVVTLYSVLKRVFEREGRIFNGNLRYFEDIRNVYTKPIDKKLISKRSKGSLADEILIVPGSENKRSLEVKLNLLEVYIDSLNRDSDSTFVSKTFLYSITNILGETVPTLLLSVSTPFTIIGEKMVVSILGSVLSMVFVALALFYMYTTIIKQKQLSELKNDFISNVSHELKTPITTAQAAVQGLQFAEIQRNPEKVESYLATAVTEIRKLSAMVDKILTISLVENPGFILNPTRFNFESMLKKITSAQQMRTDKPIQIRLTCEAVPEIVADKTELQQVVINLIDNAIKYSGDQVTIGVLCRNYTGGIEILVSDDGNGIPREYRDYVFDKFFRVPGADGHKVKGYGLGLNYVKTMIEKHRGSIVLADAAGKGSTFIIKLPQ
jgi:signal transduction histidine kinase